MTKNAVSEADEANVDRLVNEALADVNGLVSPKELEVMRQLLRAKMLTTPEGQRRVRAMRPEPVVERSASVSKDASEGADETAGRKRRPA